MRTTKRLPLALLAVGVILLLASCNGMLDGIFPDRQIIDVHVMVRAATHSDYILTSSYVNVQLTDSSGYPITSPVALAPTSVSATSPGYVDYYITFTKLKNQSYGLNTYYYGAVSGPPPFYSGNVYPGALFYTSANFGVYQVTLPYYQSSDITDLYVYID